MYTAIIVEPRKHRALFFVLNNFLENLNDDWNIIIFHGNLNIDYINNIINNKLSKYKKRIALVNLCVNNMTVYDYNRLFITNKAFYNYIPTEIFLVFQTDTMICKKNKHLINEFLKYDYVGAPWPHFPKNNSNVGNGGLSLRRKSKMLEIMEKDDDINLPEDVFFSCSNKVNTYKPSFEQAKRFAIEHIYSDITFGFHKPWIACEYNKFCKLYPEIKELELLQK